MTRVHASGPPQRQAPGPFQEDLIAAFSELRSALSRLVESCNVSPTAAGDIARIFKLNRNIAWRIVKMLASEDPASGIMHMPGEEAIEAITHALIDHGASAEPIARFRAACDAFERVITAHAGDRDTLELILDGMDGVGAGERLERSRRLAFRGLSGVWGVQARVRCSTNFIAPSAKDPSRLDLGLIGGVVDFRRLRPGPRWPLFRPRTYDENGNPIASPPGVEALDSRYQRDPGPKFLSEYCSDSMPEISVIQQPNGWVYELCDWPVGNTGAFTCFFGQVARAAAPRTRTPTELHAENFAHIAMPVETLQFDLIVHKSLDFLLAPDVFVLGQPDGIGPVTACSARTPGGAHLIPIGTDMQELPGSAPDMTSPLVPAYRGMIESVMERQGHQLRDFRALRLLIKYPPMHSTVLLRSDLPA
jgi:hypothetical protein